MDFGAAREYDKIFIDHYIKIIHGAAMNDKEMVLKMSKEIGFLNGDENHLMKEAHFGSVLAVGTPF